MTKKSALIVVDIQYDFCPGGALAVAGGDLIVPLVNMLMKEFPTVIVTQDWHPLKHVSFASSHPDGEEFTLLEIDGLDQNLWPDHCVQGTSGADLHDDIDMKMVSLVLRKGATVRMDSYSAFLENDKKTKTGLDGYLKSLHIKTVYICGLATDYCVYFSAMDAVGLGFDTHVVIDACRGIDVPEGSLNEKLKSMEKAGIKIVNSSSIIDE